MMEHHRILHFLFVHGLTIIFLVSEMGVRNQQNSAHKVLILMRDSLFVGLGQKGSLLIETKTT
jgi:hypothetical protein